jgi:RNase adapter protein RapZ
LAEAGRVSGQDKAAMSGPPTDIVIITGMSGAGRSTTAKSLEDLEWYVIDNLPPGLLPTMADLAMRSDRSLTRIAAVMDVRSRAFSTDLASSIRELSSRGIRPRVLFLEASDETLVRRFENVRRPHPLQEDGRVVNGIAAERQLLSGIREEADLVLDTSALNVHELRARVRDFFGTGTTATMRVNVVSFGYKYGVPVDADLVADCRFLPNPRWVESLAPLTGQDDRVRDYVLKQPGAEEFLKSYTETLRIIFDGYGQQGKQYVTLAVGCTGGKHRSVTMAEQLGLRLEETGLAIQVAHRDLGRE